MLDIGLGFAVYFVIALVIFALARALGMFGNPAQTLQETKQKLEFFAPQSGLQMGLFIGLSAMAGWCEICSGYLQRQFSAWLHTAAGGVVL